MLYAGLITTLFGDVLVGRYIAAVFKGLMLDEYNAPVGHLDIERNGLVVDRDLQPLVEEDCGPFDRDVAGLEPLTKDFV